MDFDSLSRRELQALCKRNKLPATLTNAAMLDSLKSLHLVEGIIELSVIAPQTDRGETEDALFTPARSQRRLIKEDIAVCGTRRSARLLKRVADGNSDFLKNAMFTNDCHHESNVELKENLGDFDETSVVTETSVAPQTNRRKTEEALFTPASSEFMSLRRSVREDSAAEQICGTRRSERLEEKRARLLIAKMFSYPRV